MAINYIPEDYHTLTSYLIVSDCAQAIEFYKQAFGATELLRMNAPGGDKIGHAELKIGDSILMLADEMPEMDYKSPQTLGGTPVSFLIYVEDVDAQFPQAIAAGATETRPVKDQFYGDRTGTLTDPFGHVWTLATHTEDVSPEEMERRMQACGSEQQQSASA